MNYWLSPTGKVTAGSWIGCHYELARNIIDEKFGDEFDAKLLNRLDESAVTFLESKGYIRYMDWGKVPTWVIYTQKPTRIQKRKMFELTGFIYEK